MGWSFEDQGSDLCTESGIFDKVDYRGGSVFMYSIHPGATKMYRDLKQYY